MEFTFKLFYTVTPFSLFSSSISGFSSCCRVRFIRSKLRRTLSFYFLPAGFILFLGDESICFFLLLFWNSLLRNNSCWCCWGCWLSRYWVKLPSYIFWDIAWALANYFLLCFGLGDIRQIYSFLSGTESSSIHFEMIWAFYIRFWICFWKSFPPTEDQSWEIFIFWIKMETISLICLLIICYWRMRFSKSTLSIF